MSVEVTVTVICDNMAHAKLVAEEMEEAAGKNNAELNCTIFDDEDDIAVPGLVPD